MATAPQTVSWVASFKSSPHQTLHFELSLTVEGITLCARPQEQWPMEVGRGHLDQASFGSSCPARWNTRGLLPGVLSMALSQRFSCAWSLTMLLMPLAT